MKTPEEANLITLFRVSDFQEMGLLARKYELNLKEN